MYECLIGYPPFFADDSVMTCRKILHWQKCLTWPADKIERLSPECLDFVKRCVLFVRVEASETRACYTAGVCRCTQCAG